MVLKNFRVGVLVLCAFLLAVTASAKEKVAKLTFEFAGKTRTYYSLIPDGEWPLPVVVLLHGSGRDGLVMADCWKDLAAKEHFIIAAPDAWNSAGWDTGPDSIDFFHAMIEEVAAKHAIDRSRIYLFGHSAGAAFSLVLSLIDSEYYAAAAVHPGALRTDQYNLFDYAQRKMPVAVWVGDRDPNFPLDLVNATKKEFEQHGSALQLSIISQHDHNYYAISDSVNRKAWDFLKPLHLTPPVPADGQEAPTALVCLGHGAVQ
jgi:poly(3-hydroxybutyrate) depolymerase